jgi:hypothetical protein
MRLLNVDETAMKAWINFVERHPDQDSYRLVLNLHDEHVNRTIANEQFDCGLYLTDVPEADLTVLGIYNEGKAALRLYSREEAVKMAHCIMNALGMSSQGVQ